MSNLGSLVEKYGVDSIHTVVKTDDQKFLCFTRLADTQDTFFIVVSDGVNVWRRDISEIIEDALTDLVEDRNSRNTESLLTQIKNSFTTGKVTVALVDPKLKMTIGSGTAAVDFDLHEVKAAVKKKELEMVLFRLAEQTMVLETRLSKAIQSLEKLQAQRQAGASGINALMDLGTKKIGGAKPKAIPKKVGMSMVNPGSRKRKTATGVDYD